LFLQPPLVTPRVWGDVHSSMVLTPLWSVGNCVTVHMYEHCFLPLLPVFVLKCCVKLHCSLPHNPYCCSLPSPMCLLHLLICTCLNSSPIACPPSSVLSWSLFHIWFNNYVSIILFSLLCFVFWACHSHWLKWSHECFVQYVVCGLFIVFVSCMPLSGIVVSCTECHGYNRS